MNIQGLKQNIQYMKGIGPKKAELYQKLGIVTIEDLLEHYPRKYLDLRATVSIYDAPVLEQCLVRADILRKLPVQRIRYGMTFYKFLVSDGTGDLLVTLYNNPYLFEALQQGQQIILSGKMMPGARRQMQAPSVFFPSNAESLYPVYPLTQGLSNKSLQKDMKTGFDFFGEFLTEPLPDSILSRYNLLGYKSAVKSIHFPQDLSEFDSAKKRLSFDELFSLSLAMEKIKKQNRKQSAVIIQNADIFPFSESLPFTLTGAQQAAIADCVRDLQGKTAMNRLIQGDVGSGKTAVAAAICYLVCKAGYQAAVMAPTSILAEQHAKSFEKMLAFSGLKVALLTGAMTAKAKAEVKIKLAAGEIDLVVGTHALAEESTEFSKLGLVVTDEQHRFGVRHRGVVAKKGENPHLLVMSATPIPRTLSLTVFGDLDLSVIDQLPVGRKPIKTYLIDSSLRQKWFAFARKLLDEGRQAYIICPLIESEDERATVTEYVQGLKQTGLAGCTAGILHGRMSAAQKEEAMSRFSKGETQILVATTVVEVGVDVPNAAVMLIENAECFGLSQLHQLRGRIGRGGHQSYCMLCSDTKSQNTQARLKIMCATNNGFEISEQDLKLRGPGDFFGRRQHGLPELKVADLLEDTEILRAAQKEAARILRDDPELRRAEHKGIRRMVSQMTQKMLSIN